MKKVNKKDKSKEASTIKILGYEFTAYNFFLTLFFVALSIWGTISYFHKKEMLKDSAYTTGKIIWVGRTAGKTVGQPECNYEYTVDGQRFTGKAERDEDLNIIKGDCFGVKYSNKEPDISVLLTEQGKIPCNK